MLYRQLKESKAWGPIRDKKTYSNFTSWGRIMWDKWILVYIQFAPHMENKFVYALEFLTPKEVIGRCGWAENNASKCAPLVSSSDAVHGLGLIPLWLNLYSSWGISIGGDIGTLSFLFTQSTLSSYLLICFSHEEFSWAHDKSHQPLSLIFSW